MVIQNDSRSTEFKTHTSNFVEIILNLWKIFNVNTPYKDIRLNDSLYRPLTHNDERFSFLLRIVKWLELWENLPNKDGKLSKQTFTSFRRACIALPEICNYLIENWGFSYLLTSFLQTDPLEHHFGLYRVMSGANYHISYLQILETERRLKVSNILILLSEQSQTNSLSIQMFVQSFTSMTAETIETTDSINLEP